MTKLLSLLAVVGLLASPAFASEEKPAAETAAKEVIKCEAGDKECAAKAAAKATPAAGEMEKKVEEKAKH